MMIVASTMMRLWLTVLLSVSISTNVLPVNGLVVKPIGFIRTSTETSLHGPSTRLFSATWNPASSSSSSSASTSTSKTSSNFWDDPVKVQELEDIPPADILKEIQDAPWKGGLEPVPVDGIPPQDLLATSSFADQSTLYTIPSDLHALILRNGPGRIRVGDAQYGHWFDGDGFVSKLYINGQSSPPVATFSGRYVQTDRFVKQTKENERQGNPNFLSSLFGSKVSDNGRGEGTSSSSSSSSPRKTSLAVAGAWTKRGKGRWWENILSIPANSANTNVLMLPNDDEKEGDVNEKKPTKLPRVFALAEGGRPIELDGSSLDTIGPISSFISSSSSSLPPTFSAHYKRDPITGEIFNHCVQLIPSSDGGKIDGDDGDDHDDDSVDEGGGGGGANANNYRLISMKFSPEGKFLARSEAPIPFLTFVHDSALSEHFFICLVPPFMAPDEALLSSVMGGEPLGKRLGWNPSASDGTTLALLFCKETMKCVSRIDLPQFSAYHLLDAFEEESSSSSSSSSSSTSASASEKSATTTTLTFRVMIHDPPAEERERLEECFYDLYRSSDVPAAYIHEYKIENVPLPPSVTKSTTTTTTATAADAIVVTQQRIAPDVAGMGELPEMNWSWKEYKKRYAYINLRHPIDEVDFTNGIQKVDMSDKTGQSSSKDKTLQPVTFGDGVYAGGAIFVPKKENTDKKSSSSSLKEDDGYLITQLYRSNDHVTDICILDASTMKVITRVPLQSQYHVPYQFHGTYWDMDK